MKLLKKSVSLLLSIAMLLSVSALSVSADADFTIEKETTLTRFVSAESSLTGGETKTATFTVDTTANYALFTKCQSAATGTTTFAITDSDGAAAPFTYRTAVGTPGTMSTGESYAHAHYTNSKRTYEKVGNIAEVSVALEADKTYTLSVSRAEGQEEIALLYIDLRCLTLPITGGYQEISPADFSSFSTTTATHVTEQLDYTGNNPSSEYSLIGDYNSENLTAKHSSLRTYMISAGATATYTLDVQTAGYYRLHFKTKTWVSAANIKAGNEISFNVPFAVDGEEINTFRYSYVPATDGQAGDPQLLSSEVFYLEEGINVLALGNVDWSGAYVYGLLLQALPDYDPDAIQTILLDIEPKVVDDTLARFEFKTDSGENHLVVSATDDIYQFNYTASQTAEYAIFLKNANSTASGLMISATDSTGTEVYNTTYTLKGKNYVRYGENAYTAIAMTAGETYTISLTGIGDAITIPYLDLRAVNALKIPAEGNFAISPSDFTGTTIGYDHMSQQFDSQNYKNEDYPMVGNYYSSALSEPRTRATTVHLGNGTYAAYTLNVQTAGYYQITLPTPTTYPGSAKKESFALTVNGVSYDTKGWVDSAKDVTFDPFYLHQGINVVSIKNLTVPYTNDDGTENNGGGVGAYIKSILFAPVTVEDAAIDVTTTTETDTTVMLPKATASAGSINYNGTCCEMAAGTSLSYEINVQEKGTYSVYVAGVIPQRGVNITIDGVDRTSYAYEDLNQAENVTASYGNKQDKKLSYPIELAPGKHTVTLTFKNGYKDKSTQLTDADNYLSKLYQIWVRRVDIVPSETETVYLRSWDFVSKSYLNEADKSTSCAGWLFPHQSNQGGTITLNNFTTVRNVVFILGSSVTYRINAPKSGYYDISAYIAAGKDQQHTITLTANDKPYTAVHVGDNTGNKGVTFESVYLPQGVTDVVLTAPASQSSTLRLFGVSVATVTTDYVKQAESAVEVSANFDAAYTGEVVIALYNDNKEMVGMKTETVTNADYICATVPFTGAPTSAKIMVWKDLSTSIAPLCDATTITSTSDLWK